MGKLATLRNLTVLAIGLWAASAVIYTLLFVASVDIAPLPMTAAVAAPLAPASPPQQAAPAANPAPVAQTAPPADVAPAVDAQPPTSSTPATVSDPRTAPSLLPSAPPLFGQRPAANPTPASAATGVIPTIPLAARESGLREAWFRTTRETGLWSGPDAQASEFVKVPAGTVLLALEARGRRTFGYVGGDGKARPDGEVWVETADLQPIPWPRWARSRRPTGVRADPRSDATIVASLPAGAYLETIGEQTGRWARVFYLGDGRDLKPLEGWAEASDFILPVAPQETLSAITLTRARLAESPPDVWLSVPYRSQLDGSPYAEANCGPTTVAMLLEAFGRPDALDRLRAFALEQQGTPDCDSCGLFIEHLAALAESRGAKVHDLAAKDQPLRRWSLDEVRAQLRQGRAVVAQVMYRLLPGRGTSGYWGDHYVVLTGILGDSFIYNDPIDYDGSGYGRVITADALDKAMAASDFPFAAFAVGRETVAPGPAARAQ